MPIPPSTTAAAATFAKKWANLGDEKQDSQRFWFELLQKVYGVEDPASFVRFEQRVKLSHVSFIDVMIPATHTMIEMKSRGKDLDAPIKQSDGTFLKPFEQAKRYAAALPYSERPRWIVSCNFAEFHVYDMERPNDEPERILLKDLGKEAYRLKFLVDVRDSHIQREMDLSREAGTLVGRIYNALLPAYGDAPTAKDLQDLNKLIVRLVFCFYAEDAGLFGARNAFQHCMETFRAENFRLALITLFRVLDQKPEGNPKSATASSTRNSPPSPTSTAASSPKTSPSRPWTSPRAPSSSKKAAASTGAAFLRPFLERSIRKIPDVQTLAVLGN